MNAVISRCEARTLQHIEEHIASTGRSPSIRALCSMAGVRSHGSMHRSVQSLVGVGLVERDESRQLRLVAGRQYSITRGRKAAASARRMAALVAAERFIAGFEGDEMQVGIDGLLAQIRAAIGEAA